ncbi:MAG TPA: prohibitin family protein [Thermofilum sp.]|nr:prohibitin family protein [Thermofilum sp.]
MSETIRRISRIVALLVLVLIVFLAVFGASMISSVGVSEVAIIVDPLVGSVTGSVIGPRFFIKAPWQQVVRVGLAVESLDMWTDFATGQRGEWPSIASLTKDGLEVYVDITIRWRVDPEKVTVLYLNYPGLDWEVKALAPLVRETVRNIISNYTAMETIEKRAEISRRIASDLIEVVNRERSFGGAIIIQDIDLRNIQLPSAFKSAVEQKLAEEQQKLAAQFKRERMLIEANATATSRILEAMGEARARIIGANATSESLRLIMTAANNSTEIAQTYLTYSMLRELAEKGGNVYIVVTSGAGGAQVIPVPIPLREG